MSLAPPPARPASSSATSTTTSAAAPPRKSTAKKLPASSSGSKLGSSSSSSGALRPAGKSANLGKKQPPPGAQQQRPAVSKHSGAVAAASSSSSSGFLLGRTPADAHLPVKIIDFDACAPKDRVFPECPRVHPLDRIPLIQRVAFFACKTFVKPLELSYVNRSWRETFSEYDVWTTRHCWELQLKAPRKKQQAPASAAPSPFGGLAPTGGAAVGNSKFPVGAADIFVFAASNNMIWVVAAMIDVGFDPSKSRVFLDRTTGESAAAIANRAKRAAQQQQGAAAAAALPSIVPGAESHVCGTIALQRAVENGHSDMFNLLKESKKVPLNSVSSNGRLPVHIAASRGRVELLKSLYTESGENAVLARDKEGQTAMFHAIEHPAALKFLVKKAGADVDARRSDQHCPLHIACERGLADTVDMLLFLKADANKPGCTHNTPLHCISKFQPEATARSAQEKERGVRCIWRIVRALANAGASINTRNSDGKSALHIAVERANTPAVDAILAYCPILELQDNDGNGPAHAAACNPDLLVKLFTYDREAAKRRMEAEEDQQEDAIAAAFAAQLTAGDGSSGSSLPPSLPSSGSGLAPPPPPLSNETGSGLPPPPPMNDDDDDDDLPPPPPLPDDENNNDDDGNGAASSVVMSFNNNDKANSNNKFSNNNNDFDPASPLPSHSPGAASLRGAADTSPSGSPFCSPTRQPEFAVMQNKKGESAMQIAAASGATKAVRVMLDYDVKPTVEVGAAGAHEHSVLGVLVHRGGLDVNMRNNRGETALHLAAMHGVLDSVRHLLEFGANPQIVDNEGDSPLHIAQDSEVITHTLILRVGGVPTTLRNKHGMSPLATCCALGREQNALELLRLRSNPNTQDTYGNTPLHYAILNAMPRVVRSLLHYGASKEIRNNKARTPLQLTYQKGFVFDASQESRDVYLAMTGETVSGSTIRPTLPKELLLRPIRGIDY